VAQVVAVLLATQAQVDWAVLLQASQGQMVLAVAVAVAGRNLQITSMKAVLEAVLESWDKELAVLVEQTIFIT
jgi:hypothetical protein